MVAELAQTISNVYTLENHPFRKSKIKYHLYSLLNSGFPDTRQMALSFLNKINATLNQVAVFPEELL